MNSSQCSSLGFYSLFLTREMGISKAHFIIFTAKEQDESNHHWKYLPTPKYTHWKTQKIIKLQWGTSSSVPGRWFKCPFWMYSIYPNDMSSIWRKVKLTNTLMKEICPQSGIAPNILQGCLFAKSDAHTSNFRVTAKTPSNIQLDIWLQSGYNWILAAYKEIYMITHKLAIFSTLTNKWYFL